MTKEEIKAIIAQKIEGQGTNLDAASVLPTILNWIIDNMGGDNPLADSFIDVGEKPSDVFKEIDPETANLLDAKGLLVKCGNEYFTRTSDYLIDRSGINSALGYLEPEGITPKLVRCCFGSVAWAYEGEGMEAASLVILFEYEDAGGFNKVGLFFYEL